MNRRGGRATTRRWCGAVTMTLAALAGDVASSQTLENLSLARSYGSGVHAFFTGDFARSYEDLTAAIEAGSEDPRTRYFRGLAAMRLGRLDEAEADFSEGADLEARALGGWPVSRSLERVQGHDRLQLERHRVRARVAALQRDRAAERDRYLGAAAAQPQVLRGRVPSTRPSPAADRSNPFADQPDPAAASPEPPAAPEPGLLPPPAPADAAPAEPEATQPEPEADQLKPEMELPAAEPNQAPADTPVEAETSPDAGPAAEVDMPAEVESPVTAEGDAAGAAADAPSEPAPGVPAGEDPFDDKEPAPAKEPTVPEEPAAPIADDAPAPAAGDQ